MAAVTAVPLVAGVSSIMGSAPAGALAMAADMAYFSCFAFFDNRKPTNSWSGRAQAAQEIPGILFGEMEQRNAARRMDHREEQRGENILFWLRACVYEICLFLLARIRYRKPRLADHTACLFGAEPPCCTPSDKLPRNKVKNLWPRQSKSPDDQPLLQPFGLQGTKNIRCAGPPTIHPFKGLTVLGNEPNKDGRIALTKTRNLTRDVSIDNSIEDALALADTTRRCDRPKTYRRVSDVICLVRRGSVLEIRTQRQAERQALNGKWGAIQKNNDKKSAGHAIVDGTKRDVGISGISL